MNIKDEKNFRDIFHHKIEKVGFSVAVKAVS